MNLYLVRHAQAKPEEVDPERSLSQKGVESAKRVADFLKQSDAVSVAEIRHSTKLRARQTAEILAADGGLSAPLVEVNGLEPMADVNAAILALQGVSHDLMLVGHLPYLDRLASGLVAHRPDLAGFSFGECSIPVSFTTLSRGYHDRSYETGRRSAFVPALLDTAPVGVVSAVGGHLRQTLHLLLWTMSEGPRHLASKRLLDGLGARVNRFPSETLGRRDAECP